MSRWKNCYSAPGIDGFHVPRSYAQLTDCPGCKYGTLDEKRKGEFTCADCGRIYTTAELQQLTKLKGQKK